MSTKFPILSELITKQAEECEKEQVVAVDGYAHSNNCSSEYKIQFPANSDCLPMAGGAVISIDGLNMDLTEDPALFETTSNDITKGIGKLNLNKTLNALLDFHVEINKQLFDLSYKKKFSTLKSGKKAPRIYISNYLGTEEALQNNVYVPEMQRMCEIKYIPFDALKKLLQIISDYKTDEVKFLDLIGVAGIKLKTLLENSADPNLLEKNATDLALEMFPILNVSDASLVSTNEELIIGGYYTIRDKKFFIKLPDLSGRSYQQLASGFLADESRLFIEVDSEGATTRIPLKNFMIPPNASFESPQSFLFPVPGEVVNIELNITNYKEGMKAYLSPVIIDELDIPAIGSSKYVNYSSGDIEPFCFPLLTRGLEDGRDGIIYYEDSQKSTISKAIEKSEKYLSSLSGSVYKASSYLDKDYPLIKIDSIDSDFLNCSTDTILAIKNRPELLLYNPNKFDKKNYEKYQSLSSYGKIDILASKMPKIYKYISPALIEVPIEKNPDSISEDAYLISVPYEKIAGVKLSNDGLFKYNIYVKDSCNQISKVVGDGVILEDGVQIVEYVNPNGYAGSERISVNQENVLEIVGKRLDRSGGIIYFKADSIEQPFSIPITNEDIVEVVSSEKIILYLPSYYIPHVKNERYKVYISSIDSKPINYASIYIVQDINDEVPVEPSPNTPFDSREFSNTNGDKPICGIPIFKGGANYSFDIKSKSNVFKNGAKIYAYIGLPSNVKYLGNNYNVSGINPPDATKLLSPFSFPDRVFKVSNILGPTGYFLSSLLVPIDIFYELDFNPTSDFYSLISERATLKFPGNKYSCFNFSSLEWINEAYLIITDRKLSDLEFYASRDSGIPEIKVASIGKEILNCDAIKLGDSENKKPAFLPDYSILGIALEDDTGIIQSTFGKAEYPDGTFNDIFGAEKDFLKQSIYVKGKIRNLCVIVPCVDDHKIFKNYDVYLGDEKIDKKLKKCSVKNIGDGKAILHYKNVSVKNSGISNFSLVVKPTKNTNQINAKGTYTQGTAILKYNNVADDNLYNFTINDDGSLITLSDITKYPVYDVSYFKDRNLDNDSGFITTAISESITGIVDVIYPNYNYKFSFLTKQYEYKTLQPLTIIPSTDLNLKLDSKEEVIFGNFKRENISTIDRFTLSIPTNAVFDSNCFVLYSDYYPEADKDYALLFFKIFNYGLFSLEYKVPKIIKAYKVSNSQSEDVDLTKPLELVANDKYKFEVSDLDKSFSIIINDVVLVPDEKPEPLDNGNYVATISITEEVASKITGNTTVICASTNNSTEYDAIYDVGESYQELLDNSEEYTDGVPQSNELIEAIKSVPLRLANIKLDLPMPAKEIIRSFCDYSFELAKELKYSLNGFRTLMTPIQVIFSIIDVICSLLNPVKLGKAIIRLFEGLLDLVALIPILSVPVMLLQLLLHAIKLVECVFEKILLTIRSIENLILDLIYAGRAPVSLRTVKEIEETIEEFLNGLELDIKILDPIVSILSIFLELLGLVFRFPCTITAGEDALDCGVDGSILGGWISDTVAVDSEILPEKLLPIAQFYTQDVNGSTETPIEYEVGDIVANNSGQTYYDSIGVETDSLRGTSYGFNVSFSSSFTKTKKNGNKSGKCNFIFDEKGKTTALRKVNIDPNQTIDNHMALFEKSGIYLKVASFGNMYSPIDGEEFLVVDSDKKVASVKPLYLEFEVPINEIDPDSGSVTQIGSERFTRTFDNIPMMCLLDDELNVYFVQEEGIKFNADGYVDKIETKIINTQAAPKLKFSKDDDFTEDGEEIKVYDFPQLYFFDMRSIRDQLQQYCVTSSINSFPLEEDNSQDIIDIVGQAQICFQNWQSNLNDYVARIRNRTPETLESLQQSQIPFLQQQNDETIQCINDAANNICRFAINGLNTSFKILNDSDFTPRSGYVDGSVSTQILQGFPRSTSRYLGASEYAAGIGDNGIVETGEIATIEIIPRDIYNEVLVGDFSGRISVKIKKDETGDARLISYSNGLSVEKQGDKYIAKITSSKPGEVQISCKICDRTVEALIYQSSSTSTTTTEVEEGCVEQIVQNTNQTNINILSKVDRVLSVYFINAKGNKISKIKNDDDIITDPQQFGTSLEN